MRLFLCLLTLIAIAGCAEEQATSVADASSTNAVGVSTARDAATKVTEVAFNVAGAPTVDINVPGMMCPHGCAPKVHEALVNQPGVLDVKVVYETKTATVAVEESTFDADAAIDVLEEEYGFTDSTLIKANSVSEADAPTAPVETEQVNG